MRRVPPRDIENWDDRCAPDPARLKEKLAPFAPAFDLSGDGLRFLQDLEKPDGTANSVDTLFIDSAGANTVQNNANLMVTLIDPQRGLCEARGITDRTTRDIRIYLATRRLNVSCADSAVRLRFLLELW